MSSLNKAIIIGNLGQDPEMKTLANGATVTNFTMATTDNYKNKSGDPISKTEWHQVAAWNRVGEVVGKWARKGSKVYVEGKIESRKWKDNEGRDRVSFGIRAMNVLLLDKKGDGNSEQPERNAAGFVEPSQKKGKDFDDDIPF